MTTALGNLTLSNPIMTASGTFGYGFEYEDFMSLDSLGAFVVKGTTLEPRQGNPYPRMAQTPAGMLNAVGLQNPGVEHFISHTWPRYGVLEDKVIVNVSGAKIEDYVRVAELLTSLIGLRAIELNISCPNVKQGGMAFGTTSEGAAAVTKAVRAVWPRHLMVKLSPNVTNIVDIAKAVEGEGADSVSLINTLMGMAVDIERRCPVLSTITGGLSGPAVKPVALRMVWQVAKSVKIPVVGLGGISSATDAIEFIMAGASAVQIGTYNFVDPTTAGRIPEEIDLWCQGHGVKHLMDIRGII